MNLSHDIKHAHIYVEKIWCRKKHCGNPKLFLREETKFTLYLLVCCYVDGFATRRRDFSKFSTDRNNRKIIFERKTQSTIRSIYRLERCIK